MTTTLIKLYEGQPAASNTTVYTAPSNTRVRILQATAANDTTTAVYFTAHIVPSGVAAGDAYLVINRKTLGSRETYQCSPLIGHVLEPGDFISIIAETASQVTMQISGVSIT